MKSFISNVKATHGYADISGLFKVLISVSLMLTLILACIAGLKTTTGILMENEAERSMSAGVIIRHEYVNGYASAFGGYVPPRYRLHIKGEYEYDGETKEGETYYDVEEEIYNFYKDGDYFNSSTFMTDYANAQTAAETTEPTTE